MKTLFKYLNIVLIIFSCFWISYAAGEELALNEKSHKALTEAQQFMENDNHKKAIQILNELSPQLNELPYDQAVTYQILAYAYYAIDDLKSANESFIKALKLNTLPEQVAHELKYSVAKLLIYQDDFKRALEYLDKWFAKETEPISEAYLMKASIHHNLKNYKEMIPPLKKAISKNRKAPFAWHELLISAHIKLKQYRSATNALETVIKLFPDKKDPWLQLASVYQLRKLEKKALAITELSYNKGYLNQEQTLALANNYLFLDMPYKAAVLLEKEITENKIDNKKENLELLANSWFLAQEKIKAAETYKVLINLYNEPKLRFLLGQLYYQLQQWKDTIDTLKPYLEMEEIEHKGEAYIFLGIAAYEINNKDQSLKSFNKAIAFKNTKEQAKWWIEHLMEELEETKNVLTSDS